MKKSICIVATIIFTLAVWSTMVTAKESPQPINWLTFDQAQKVVLAYEPIWAIGTGLTATPEAADKIIKQAIRDVLCDLYDSKTAEAIRVQYGGSVKPDNMAAFIVMPNIDGALVGGASLKVESFAAIVKNAIDALAHCKFGEN